jgi:hypothetical protein
LTFYFISEQGAVEPASLCINRDVDGLWFLSPNCSRGANTLSVYNPEQLLFAWVTHASSTKY